MSHIKTLQVNLGERSYPIKIGQNILASVPNYLHELNIKRSQKLLIVTDSNVTSLYGETLQQILKQSGYDCSMYTIPAGEKSKSLEQYEQILSFALEQKLDRHSIILALGGGVVGDIAGFVASTYMRGIDFIQLPTTVQAHDSSVGGKVGINHSLGKNMIGSFHQPLAVLYDTKTLNTLPQRELLSGSAEVLKLGFIKDDAFLDWLERHRSSCISLQEPYMSELLYTSCRLKAEVVSEDEKEQGVRAILNFGHTFGHAFERLGNYQMLTHGEAIAYGMSIAAKCSDEFFATSGIYDRVCSMLRQYGLPTNWRELPWTVDDVIQTMYTDKKVYEGKITLVLLSEIGTAQIVKGVREDQIKSVWSTYS